MVELAVPIPCGLPMAESAVLRPSPMAESTVLRPPPMVESVILFPPPMAEFFYSDERRKRTTCGFHMSFSIMMNLGGLF
jgi:hypothetical protein